MIDVGGGYFDIPAVKNGGFQDDRCRFKPVSIFVGNGQSLKLAPNCSLIINELAKTFNSVYFGSTTYLFHNKFLSQIFIANDDFNNVNAACKSRHIHV